MKISEHAIDMTGYLKEGLKKRGYPFLIDSPTNQQFVILPDAQLEILKTKVKYCFWEKTDSKHTAIRLATSWATRKESIDELFAVLDSTEKGLRP